MISIIGIDKFKAGYMAAKAAQERAMVAGPIPVGILRAAQFHEFVGPMMNWGRRGDVTYVPRMRTQLVAAGIAAEGLADLATAPATALAPGASGMAIPEVAGPRPELLADAAALLAQREGDPVTIEVAGDSDDPDGDLYAGGALLSGPGARLAGPTFSEWLSQRDGLS